MIRPLAWILALLTLASMAGCPRPYKEHDGTHREALPLPVGQRVADLDGLDFKRGDKVDWKVAEATRDGQGVLTVDVGDLFAPRHGINSGSIMVKNQDAQDLAAVTVEPAKHTYKLTFDVTKGQRYFVVFRTDQGKANYAVKFDIEDKAPKACDACTADQICVDERCVQRGQVLPPPPEPCDPSCRRGYFCLPGRDGREPRCVRRRKRADICDNECERIFDYTPVHIQLNWKDKPQEMARRMDAFEASAAVDKERCIEQCRKGTVDIGCLAEIAAAPQIPTCKPPCGGPCRRGFFCNEKRNKCVRSNPCKGVTCPSGQKCRGGRCIAPPPPACVPPCKAGFKCNKAAHKCEVQPLGPIDCIIIQATPAGANGTNLTLNRGKQHKVAKGDTGKIPGVGGFVVKSVFTFRSKAFINKPLASVSSKKKCTINRKKWKP